MIIDKIIKTENGDKIIIEKMCQVEMVIIVKIQMAIILQI